MNSTEIKEQIEKVFKLLTYQSKAFSDYERYSASGLTNLRKAIVELEKTKLFQERVEVLKSSTWYPDFADQMSISKTENNQISSFINFISVASQGIKEYIQLTSHTTDEYVLHIYLPNRYSFSDLESLSNDLKKCIELPALDVGGSATIISAQPGSIWLVVAFATSAAVTIIGKIVSIATKANIEIQKGKIFANYAQNLNLSNEMTKTILDAQKKLIEEIIAKEIDEAKKDLDVTTDITKVERLKLAVTKMSELLRKDIKFLPAPKMELSIMDSFPKSDEIDSVEKELKKLASPHIDSPEINEE